MSKHMVSDLREKVNRDKNAPTNVSAKQLLEVIDAILKECDDALENPNKVRGLVSDPYMARVNYKDDLFYCCWCGVAESNRHADFCGWNQIMESTK